MGRQYFADILRWTTADSAAYASSSSEAVIYPVWTIPANTYQDGRIIKITHFGKYSTTATPTLRFRVRQGGLAGTLLGDTGTTGITSQSGVTSVLYKIEFYIQTRSNGATGTVLGIGDVKLYNNAAGTVGSATGAPAIAAMTVGGLTAPATATFDLTANSDLAVTATWSANSASNTLTGMMEIIEALN